MRLTLFALIAACLTANAGNITYRVADNPKACVEVRIPKWTAPPARGQDFHYIDRGICDFDVRSAGQSALYIGMSCGSVLRWRVKETYALDLRQPPAVRRIDSKAWEETPVLVPSADSPVPVNYMADGVRYQDRLFPKSGAQWDLYHQAFSSPGNSRIAVNSFDGVVKRPPGGDLASFNISVKRGHYEGKFWTEIYDISTARRLIQISGNFHGEDPMNFQGRGAWLGGRYYAMPLDPKGMRRLLLCDIDMAAKSTGVVETDAAPLHAPALRDRPFEPEGPQARITGFRDEAAPCTNSSEYKALRITASIDVPAAGDYELSLELKGKNGRGYQQTAKAELPAGHGEISVPFSGYALHAWLRVDGPYTIGLAQLRHLLPGGHVLADTRPDAGTTQAYALDRFATSCK